MQGSNTVNGESVVDIHMCHMNQMVLVDDCHIFLWIFCFDFLIQFLDDRYKVRNYIKKVVHWPFFQSFCKDGMVCVSTYFGYDFSSFIKVDSTFCQETDQFRNDHTWVSIVNLDHCVVCKVMQVAAFFCCFVQDELSSIGYHEVLLEDTELTSVIIAVIRIQEQCQVVKDVLFVKGNSIVNHRFICQINVK